MYDSILKSMSYISASGVFALLYCLIVYSMTYLTFVSLQHVLVVGVQSLRFAIYG